MEGWLAGDKADHGEPCPTGNHGTDNIGLCYCEYEFKTYYLKMLSLLITRVLRQII